MLQTNAVLSLAGGWRETVNRFLWWFPDQR